jgi:hypothetical protein
MTLAQQARLQGWNASLRVRGVSVSLHPSGPVLKALIEPVVPESEEYALSKEVRNYSKVHILRTSVGATKIGPGSSFINQVTGETYRVAEVEDNGIDIKVIYHCETAPAPITMDSEETTMDSEEVTMDAQ